MPLINNLKYFRKERGYSQEYMADLLSMDQSAYSRLERKGHICPYRLQQLANILNVTPEQLTTPLDPVAEAALPPDQVDDRFQQQEDTIQAQAEEIIFLRRQVSYLQAVWHQYCGGGTTGLTSIPDAW